MHNIIELFMSVWSEFSLELDNLISFLQKFSDPCEQFLPFGPNNMHVAWSMGHCPSYLGDFDSRTIASGEPAADETDFVQR